MLIAFVELMALTELVNSNNAHLIAFLFSLSFPNALVKFLAGFCSAAALSTCTRSPSLHHTAFGGGGAVRSGAGGRNSGGRRGLRAFQITIPGPQFTRAARTFYLTRVTTSSGPTYTYMK